MTQAREREPGRRASAESPKADSISKAPHTDSRSGNLPAVGSCQATQHLGGAARPKGPSRRGPPVSDRQQGPAWVTRHCKSVETLGHLRAWVFLARTPRVSTRHRSEAESTLLASQVLCESGTRPAKSAAAAAAWLQGSSRLAVRNGRPFEAEPASTTRVPQAPMTRLPGPRRSGLSRALRKANERARRRPRRPRLAGQLSR